MIKNKHKKALFNNDFIINQLNVAYEFAHFRDNWTHNPGIMKSHSIPLILNGEATLYFNEKPVKVKRGDIALIEKGIRYRSEGNIKFHNLDIVFQCLPEKNLKFSKHVVHIKDVEHFQRLYSEIISIYENPNPLSYPRLLSLLYNLLWEIASEYSDEYPIHKKFHLIEKSVDYMNSNIFDSNLSLESITEKSGISIKYFRNIFKEIYGTTPLNYINKKRLKRAEEMLSYSNYPIDTISNHCGFNSSIYFTRLFKEKYGMPPGKYRRN